MNFRLNWITSPFFWPLYSLMFISAAFPTSTGNFDFVHVTEKNALILNISKNSPPVAALTDETMPPLTIEPAQELKIEKNVRVLAAGSKSAWPRLKKVSVAFERAESFRVKRFKFILAQSLKYKAPVITSVETADPRRIELRPTKISELIHLVEPVNYGGTNPRFDVDKPTPGVTGYYPLPSTPLNAAPAAAAPAIKPQSRVAQATNPTNPATPSNPSNPSTLPLPPGKAPTTVLDKKAKVQSVDFKIMGQVQLAGGLALIPGANKLQVQWKTGLETVDGDLDQTTGNFVINVPHLQGGKVFATLIDDKSQPLGRGEFDLDGAAVTPGQQILNNVAITVDPVETNIRGEVLSAYSYDNVKIPVADSEVFAPGQIRERVDSLGRYKISSLGAGSTFTLDAYGPDHWGTRVISETQRMDRVPLYSNKMMQSLFDLTGHPDNNTEFGVIWGVMKRKNKPQEGVEVTINTPGIVGPIYFNELQIPDKNLDKTSKNGLFAFIKVPAGLHIISSRKDKMELPSKIISAAPGMVSYSEIDLKSLTLSGRVVDPISKQFVEAQVGVVGTSYSTTTSSGALHLKIPSTDAALFVEANAGDDYFPARVTVPRSEAKDLTLYVIKKDWLGNAMSEAQMKNPDGTGMLLGLVTGPQYHVNFEDQDIKDAQIYYFNKDGKIEPGRTDSLEDGGMFLVTGLKPGLHTVVMTSADGQMMNSQVIVSQFGVLNIVKVNLRP